MVQRVKKAVREGVLAAEIFERVQSKMKEEQARLASEAKQVGERIEQVNDEGRKLAIACQGPGAQFLDARITDLKGELATLEVRQAELARRLKLSRNRVSQILSLTLLGPGIQGKVLRGELGELSTRDLLAVAQEESWNRQRGRVQDWGRDGG